MSDAGSPLEEHDERLESEQNRDDNDDSAPARSGADAADKDNGNGIDDDDDDAGDDSDALSEVDIDQFDDYNPETAAIDDRPVEIDEDVARTLKASKRKAGAAGVARKVKEARREKKRPRRDEDDDDEVSPIEGDDGDNGRRPRKARKATERRKAASPEPVNEEDLTPEQRRQRAIERAIDAAAKSGKPKRRKKTDDIDLENMASEQVALLKAEMERACIADNAARSDDQPAVHKLKMLPEVINMLNRNNAQEAVLDPDENFLEAVKYFLEPLNDGSLPAYNIQRDIFAALTRLPIHTDHLRASGLGKVVLFYTRSRQPDVAIKRMAERLLGEWSRPILRRTDDYKKRFIETREFDYQAAKIAQRQQATSFALAQRPAQQLSAAELARQRLLAPIVNTNRARVTSLPESYTIAPKSTFDGTRSAADFRPIGAGGIEAFRKMTQKGKKRGG